MSKKEKKTFLDSFMSVCIDGSKQLAEDFPNWIQPIVRVLLFCFFVLISLVVFPIILVHNIFRKKTVDPFFKLRTELKSKWCGDNQGQALNELRRVKDILNKNGEILFFKGVQISPYGKFRFNEFSKILWLLYHWEFHSGNFQEASEVCDCILEKWTAKNAIKRQSGDFREEWILNKAKAILQKDGATMTQEYLLKFVDPQNDECRINKYLYHVREESKIKL